MKNSNKSSLKNWLALARNGMLRLGIFKPKHMKDRYTISEKQIKQIKDRLKKDNGYEWELLPTNYFLMKVIVNDDGTTTALPKTGMPLKAFINLKTFEVKFFPIKLLKKREK